MRPGQPRLATLPGIALIAVAIFVVRIAAQTSALHFST